MDKMVVMKSLDLEDLKAGMARWDHRGRKVTWENRDLLDPAVEESLMSGGVELPAQIQQELNLYVDVHSMSACVPILSLSIFMQFLYYTSNFLNILFIYTHTCTQTCTSSAPISSVSFDAVSLATTLRVSIPLRVTCNLSTCSSIISCRTLWEG